MASVQTHSKKAYCRLINQGADALTDAELMALILPERSYRILQRFIQTSGSLHACLAAKDTLLHTQGFSHKQIMTIKALREFSIRYLSYELQELDALNHADKVKRYCMNELAHLDVEHCIALLLNTRHQLIKSVTVSQGTRHQTSIYPREIIKHALYEQASFVILAHNHPSGHCEPSQADIQITEHIQKTLRLLDIGLLDHIIVAPQQALSLRETGKVSFQ